MLHEEYRHLRRQQTVAAPVPFVGVGLQTGCRVTVQLLPAAADQGITFVRCDLPDGENRFRASWERLLPGEQVRVLGNRHGHRVAQVEHLLSALAGLGVDNVQVVLDGPEMPAMDGSALPFVSAIIHAGIRPLDAPRDLLVVRRPVRVQQGEGWAAVLPDRLPRITVTADCAHRDRHHQSLSACLSPGAYTREIAAARRFGFAEQLWQLRRCSRFAGDSDCREWLERESRDAEAEGTRYPDEFVRHKVLDLVGDLALLGLPLIGHLRAERPDTQIGAELLRLLMATPDAWQRVAGEDFLDGRVAGPQQHLLGIGFEQIDRDLDAAVRPTYDGPRWREMIQRVFGSSSDRW